MKTRRGATRTMASGFTVVLFLLASGGCNYNVPITSSPTRKIDSRLLGNWISKDEDILKVRKLDDFVYVCSYNGELFQAFHSDVSRTPFISVQDIESDERKWAYLTYTVSADGEELVIHHVNTKEIPVETKDSRSVQKLLEDNLQNPTFFDSEWEYTKHK